MIQKTAIVIGAGIVGLATARALAVRGRRVTVIERNSQAVGASVRNFGMIWPIGQPDGDLYDTAMLSKKIWLEICAGAGIWHDRVGSLHLAYETDELDVLSELADVYAHRGYTFLKPGEVQKLSGAALQKGLLGALHSDQEMIVNPRLAIPAVTKWLIEKHHVEFIWDTAATSIGHPNVRAGDKVFSADEIYVCSGADFETLFPAEFNAQQLTKCKLQMLKLAGPIDNSRLGPALCAGLSLLHYKSFAAASSLQSLRNRIESDYPKYLEFGIHVMVCQNNEGDLIVGDSHEYGSTHDPFNRQEINTLILSYLAKFTNIAVTNVAETWNGVYPKLLDGNTNLILHPQPGVTIINGLGGAGMTMSFGLCDSVINQLS